MPSQLHARPKRSTRPSEARRALGSFAFPSVRASARQDGRRRLHECGIKDSEALVQAGAPLVVIGDPFNLEVVADILSTDAPQIEKGAACRSMGGTPFLDPAGFLKVSALGIEEQRVRVTICDGGVRDAPAAARRDRPAGPKGLAGNPSHLCRMTHPPRQQVNA